MSIGDSYAAGYQPTSENAGVTTRNGFAYQLVPLVAARGYHLTLVNFGCSGATTASALHSTGCAAHNLGPGATSYDPKAQVAAAEDFITAHRGQVALITVVLGGNDLLHCGTAASPVTCVTSALTSVTTNLTAVLSGLRSAAGPNVKIVGLTYPDVLLAGLLTTDTQYQQLASLSPKVFQDAVNPALKSTYANAGAAFIDVTQATGGYGSLSATTTVAPYGKIPVPVAQMCTLTYACEYHDIHPRTSGYAVIAKLVAEQLPPR